MLRSFCVFALFAGLSVIRSESAAAYPLLGSTDDFYLFETNEDGASQLLSDSADPDLFYVLPKRLVLATDKVTGEPLFRLSVSNGNGGEFLGVFNLDYDRVQAEASFAKIKATRPNASIKPIPFLEGVLALDLLTTNETYRLAEAEVVSTNFPHGDIPFEIRIPQDSIELIRMQLATPLGAFLTLRFMHKSNMAMPALPYAFDFTPRTLLQTYREEMKTRWPVSGQLDSFAFSNYWMTHFQRTWDVATIPDDFSLRLANQVFVPLLVDYFGREVGNNFSLRDRAAVEALSLENLASHETRLDGALPGGIRQLWGSAGILLKGFCNKHKDLVYDEKDGHEVCGSFNSNPPVEPPDVWNPFE